VYNTATAGVTPNNVIPGYYYNSNLPGAPVWKRFATGNGDAWLLTGNAGTVAGTNFIGTTDAIDWVIKTNNLERVRVLSSGNVGILTSTPGAPLTISNDANLSFPNPGVAAKGGINFRITNSDFSSGITWSQWGGVDNAEAGIYVKSGGGIAGTEMHFATSNAWATGPQTRMTIKNNGYIGILTTTPAAYVHFIAGVDNIWETQWVNNNVANGAPGQFSNTNAANGNRVLMGVTNYNANVLDAPAVMGVALSAAGESRGVNGASNSSAGVGVEGSHSSLGIGWGGLFFNDLGYTGGLYFVSDQKLKKDIKQIARPIELLKNLRGVTYKFDYEKYPYLGLGTDKQFGFISQEVEQVLPELVTEKVYNIDACKPKNAGLSCSTNSQKFKAISYIEIIPILVEGIKEQQKLIEKMQAEIDQLKLQINK